MVLDDYRFLVELYSPQGETLGQAPIDVDFEPAREWAVFCALRQGGHDALAPVGSAHIQPRWDAELGEPYMAGFRVTVGTNGRPDISVNVPNTYFKSLAVSASAELVQQGTMSVGDRFHYCVLAHARTRVRREEREEEDRPTPAAREICSRLSIRTGALDDYLHASVPFKPESVEDFQVFIPQHLLADVSTQTTDAGGCETGGVLIGHLARDSDGGGVFLVVTAQIPAQYTRAEKTRLTFTADTWAAAQGAIRLRGSDEIMVGWFHSHPVAEWCKKCPAEKRKDCTLLADFFSADDEMLHRTVFPRAWSIALLVSGLPERSPSISLYGWNRGLVASRGFHVLDMSALPRVVESR